MGRDGDGNGDVIVRICIHSPFCPSGGEREVQGLVIHVKSCYFSVYITTHDEEEDSFDLRRRVAVLHLAGFFFRLPFYLVILCYGDVRISLCLRFALLRDARLRPLIRSSSIIHHPSD